MPYQGSSTLTFKDRDPIEAGEFMNPAYTYNLHNRVGNSALSQNKYYELDRLGGRRSTLGGENTYDKTQNSTAN
jgi:hypothetical protein